MGFKDHFSGHAADYARFRPGYPADLYEFLGHMVKQRDLAWDCGTGNGQAARGLAAHFHRVIATDPSAEQIRKAPKHEKIFYTVAPAEQTEIPSHSVDLVTAAQALHWFDMERFFEEARRVTKSGSVVAVWCYGLCRVTPVVDKVVRHYYTNIIGPYWPPERRYIDEKYRSIPFPFAERPSPDLHMHIDWDLNEFMNYLRTWTASKRFQAKNDQDPVLIISRLLGKSWGDPRTRLTVRWPLYVRLGKVTPA